NQDGVFRLAVRKMLYQAVVLKKPLVARLRPALYADVDSDAGENQDGVFRLAVRKMLYQAVVLKKPLVARLRPAL
ncbi:hypothetical protein CQA04_27470, partial [Escherichia coli]